MDLTIGGVHSAFSLLLKQSYEQALAVFDE